MSDAWVDHDYVPPPRTPSKCEQCGKDMILRHYCTEPGGRIPIRSVEELDALSVSSVVYDHNCQVWQKLSYFSGPLQIARIGYFKPGDAVCYPSTAVALSAQLLDDGL